MANLMERRDKNGKLTSFTIRVFVGRDASGKPLKPATTSFAVKPGWSEKTALSKAQAFAAVFETGIRNGTISDTRQTFAAYSEYVLNLKKTEGLKPTTLTSYQDFKKRTDVLIGNIPLKDLRVEHLNKITVTLSSPGANKRTGGALSAKTIIELHHFISTVLEQAVREGLIPINLESRVSLPKRERKDPNFFTPSQITTIRSILEFEPLKWRTFINLLIVTGGRRGELLGLKWEDWDPGKKQIHITRNVMYRHGYGLYVSTPKTRTSIRYVSIPEQTSALLREYWGVWAGEKVRLGEYFVDQGFIFCQDDGNPLHPDSVTKYLAKLSNKVGFHINAHAFRHSTASALLFAGVDPISVSRRLGHASPSITLDVYGHLLQESDTHNAEVLEKLFLTDTENAIKTG